jgi:phage terminase large subunit GpA-like protein
MLLWQAFLEGWPSAVRVSCSRPKVRHITTQGRAQSCQIPCSDTYQSAPKLPVSQWVDRYRVLSSEASAEAGKWYTSRTLCLGGIMDAASDPRVTSLVVESSIQVEKTQTCFNIVGFHNHQEPAPVLLLVLRRAPIRPRHAGKSRKLPGSLVWTVGVDTAKDAIYSKLKVTTPGPGYCQFPIAYQHEFFNQLTTE